MGKLSSIVFYLSFSLLPLYLFGSGGIQPAHLMFFIWVLIVLFRKKFSLPSWTLTFLILVLYVFLVEAYYAISLGVSTGMMNALYYLYSFLILLGTYNFFKLDVGSEVLAWSTVSAVSIALVGVFIYGFGLTADYEGGRSVGTFNNPNQLGYFSVCIGSIAFLLFQAGMINRFLCIGLILSGVFLSILSLSKAAMISIFVLLAFLFIPRKLDVPKVLSGVFIAGFAISFLGYLLFTGYFDDFRFYNRIANIASESDSSIEARGYLTFLQAGTSEILFGLGDYQVKELLGHEVHSTIGSVLNNYGIIGFIFIIIFLSAWAIVMWKNYGIQGVIGICGPPMLYGLTHNGIRFTIFWVLIGLSLALAFKKRAEQRSCSLNRPQHALKDLSLEIS